MEPKVYGLRDPYMIFSYCCGIQRVGGQIFKPKSRAELVNA